MEEPEDSFTAARQELLEALAEHEGRTFLEAVRTYNRNAEFKRRIDIAGHEHVSPSLARNSLANGICQRSFLLRTHRNSHAR